MAGESVGLDLASQSGQNNIADAISDIVDAITNLSGTLQSPSGNDISYDNTLSGMIADDVQSALDELSDEKQDKLTFDNTPTQSSNNPVKSGGVYTALGNKVNNSDKGVANGIATLDSTGKVPSEQIPISIVDEQIDNKFGDDIGDSVTAWLTEHVTPSGSAVVVDDTLTIAGAAADAKKTGDEITDLKGALIEDSASGAIASFPDGGDGFAVRDLKVQMEPIQDLHGYDNPWPAGGGKNKIPYPYIDGASITVNGVTFTVSSDGTVTANGTATANAEYRLVASSVQLPSGSYTLSGLPSGASSSTFVYNTYAGSSPSSISDLWDSQIETDTTFTASEDVARLYIAIRIISGYTANNLVFKPMFESGSTATPYAPYSNICPISGRTGVTVTRTGKNLFNPSQLLLANGWSVDSNGVYSGTRGNFHNAFSTGFPELPPFKEETQYTLSLKARLSEASSFARICFHYTDGSTSTAMDIASETETVFTATSNVGKTITTISGTYGSGGNILLYLSEIQLEESISQTAYEPYQGQTVTIPLGQTVYGGTLDVTQGVLTVDRAMVDLGTLNWSYITDFTYPAFRAYGSNAPTGIKENSAMTCTAYKFVGNFASWDAITQEGNCVIGGVTSAKGCIIRDDAYTDAATFKASVTGQTLAHELATPVTVQLTAQQMTTLLGQNNVWSDADSVSVDYVADTKLYIAKAIADALS